MRIALLTAFLLALAGAAVAESCTTICNRIGGQTFCTTSCY
jgi:hypothetical protein